MRSEAATVEDYIDSLDPARRDTFARLRSVIADNLPRGFEERISYGMPGWVVPLSIFPRGYLNDPKQPLPFIGIAWQKHFLALYHFGLYANPMLLERFVAEYTWVVGKKPDMGKSCIRFTRPEHIPYELLGLLASWVSVDDWVAAYLLQIESRRKK